MNSDKNSSIIDFREPLAEYITQSGFRFETISDSRKLQLGSVVESVQSLRKSEFPIKLIFVCTHNSRRSHLAQVWAQVAAAFYGLDDIKSYSGGTEATCCNPRTIDAFRRAGFSIAAVTNGENPVYELRFSEDEESIKCFSKVYSEPPNPTDEFIAIICCDDADQKCPIVQGASRRIPLHYIDPKISDDTVQESAVYNERCLQIATEMFYIMSQMRVRT